MPTVSIDDIATTRPFETPEDNDHTGGMYRSRWNREPWLKEIRLSKRDIRLFELLNRHGPLPSHYLFALLKFDPITAWPDKTDFLERIKTLFHGTVYGTYYLNRPEWQGDNPAREIIYDLAPDAILVLKEHNIPIITRHGSSPLYNVHDFMGACCMASLQIFFEAKRYDYRDLTNILGHEKCPADAAPLSIPVEGKSLEPDAFFGLSVNKRPDFYAVEIDRSNETLQDTAAAHTSYGRKIKKYIRAFETDAFKNHYGFPQPVKVITITTNKVHMKNMQRYVHKLKAPDRFLFSFTGGFGPNWKIPKELLYFAFENARGEAVTF